MEGWRTEAWGGCKRKEGERARGGGDLYPSRSISKISYLLVEAAATKRLLFCAAAMSVSRVDHGEEAAIKAALRRYTPKIEATPDNIRRYALLKRERSSGSRIPRAHIVGVEVAREKGATTKVQVFVVPKNRHLGEDVPQEAILSQDMFEEPLTRTLRCARPPILNPSPKPYTLTRPPSP